MGSTDPERSTRDSGAFLDWLSKQPQVKGRKVGVTGYCMGAGLALRAAGNYPDRVAAAAGFHGGRLATDAPDSPHLLAPKIKAKVYIAGADEDAGFPPEQADKLRSALSAAGVENEVTIYPGAKHGYAPPDMPVYNQAAAERHWRELVKLLDETLKKEAAPA
jgi:carboxymethylenebutenolidase